MGEPARLLKAAPEPGQRVVAAYLAPLAPSSQRNLRAALAWFAERDPDTFPWHTLRREHTVALFARMREAKNPSTQRVYRAALVGVLREAWRLGMMDDAEYHRAVDLPRVKGGSQERKGKHLQEREIFLLYAACDATPRGFRDRAILALGLEAGLRRNEIATVELDGLGPDQIRVTGKGEKTRTIPLTPRQRAELDPWLAHRGTAPGPLMGRLRPGAIYEILKRLAKDAGVEFSPHDLRRTAIGQWIDASDLSTAMILAGHASISTTQLYDRRGLRAARKAQSNRVTPNQETPK